MVNIVVIGCWVVLWVGYGQFLVYGLEVIYVLFVGLFSVLLLWCLLLVFVFCWVFVVKFDYLVLWWGVVVVGFVVVGEFELLVDGGLFWFGVVGQDCWVVFVVVGGVGVFDVDLQECFEFVGVFVLI